MPDDILRYSPQSCNGPNSCGAWEKNYTESQETWNGFYQVAGLDIPAFLPGQDIEVSITITADHGGQSWMMLSCADTITEEGPWTFMERAMDDRDHHFLPSNPGIYAWPEDEIMKKFGAVLRAKWTVPEDFSCPNGRGVGRWLWKTGNSCNDDKNIASKSTETFQLSEFRALNDAAGRPTMDSCTSDMEWFITCFDFSNGTQPAPAPAPTPANPRCCYSAWGSLSDCGSYPSDASGGRCNTDFSKSCNGDKDCAATIEFV